MRSGSRIGLLVFIGTLMLEAAWILAVPPFRGSDEFDHAYRAAAVAHGEWRAESVAGDAMVTVPLHIIEAANPVCEAMPYTGPADCSPQNILPDHTGTVVSGAARYNPVFYWFIGTPAEPFTGYPALYVMRAVTAIICAALFALAAVATTIASRFGLALVGPFVVATPVAIYSASVAAPNGVEMGAAMLVWCALLGMCRIDLTASRHRTLVWLSVIGSVPLVTVRSLGPLWLLLIVATVSIVAGREKAVKALKKTPHTTLIAFVIVLAVTLVAVAWTRSQNSSNFAQAMKMTAIPSPALPVRSSRGSSSQSPPSPLEMNRPLRLSTSVLAWWAWPCWWFRCASHRRASGGRCVLGSR